MSKTAKEQLLAWISTLAELANAHNSERAYNACSTSPDEQTTRRAVSEPCGDVMAAIAGLRSHVEALNDDNVVQLLGVRMGEAAPTLSVHRTRDGALDYAKEQMVDQMLELLEPSEVHTLLADHGQQSLRDLPLSEVLSAYVEKFDGSYTVMPLVLH